MIRSFLAMIMAAALGQIVPVAAQQTGLTIPTVYEAGHFYAVPVTESGQKLRLLVDTGGGGGSGMYWITEPAAKRLGLKTTTCKVDDTTLTVAAVPKFKKGLEIPIPLAERSPCGKTLLVMGETYPEGDGQLGAGYLPGRVWTFDYFKKRLVIEDSSWRPNKHAHVANLGFQRDEKGGMTSGFPRLTIQVAGQELDMLLDTGATAHRTEAGAKATGEPAIRGKGVTSYITRSTFDRWHKEHPEWRVVEKGDDLFGPAFIMRIIEVPNVQIAGWSIGPVWFTERPDPSFHQFMAQWMDKKPEGAVGGNIFSHFVMTVDYPNAKAYFNCVTDCKVSNSGR